MTTIESKIYPNDKDIYGINAKKGANKMKKVSLEQIHEEIRRIEERLQPDQAKLSAIYDQINKKVSEFTIAIGENDMKKADKLEKELEELKKAEGLQKSLNYATEHGMMQKAIKENSKIKEMTAQYEKDTLAELDNIMDEREKTIEAFREAREAFLKATYALGEINRTVSMKCGQLEGLRPYITNPSIGNVAYSTKYQLLKFPNIDVSMKQQKAWGAGARGIAYGDITFKSNVVAVRGGAVNE